jgi:hypothetical protein
MGSFLGCSEEEWKKNLGRSLGVQTPILLWSTRLPPSGAKEGSVVESR